MQRTHNYRRTQHITRGGRKRSHPHHTPPTLSLGEERVCLLDSAAHAACRTASTNDESGMGIKIMRAGQRVCLPSGVVCISRGAREVPISNSAVHTLAIFCVGVSLRPTRYTPQRKLMLLGEAPEQSAALRHTHRAHGHGEGFTWAGLKVRKTMGASEEICGAPESILKRK